jgi:hypothetical protein
MYGLLTTPVSFDNGDGYFLGDGVQRSYNGGMTDNPRFSVNRNPNNQTVNRIIPSVFSMIDITRWLKVDLKVGADVYEETQRSGYDVYAAAFPDGMLTHRRETFKSFNSDVIVKANRAMMDSRLTMGASIGMTHYFTNRNISRSYGFDLAEPGNFDEQNAQWLLNIQRNFFSNNNRVLSRVDFAYQDMLIGEATYTRENTSTLPSENNVLHSGSAALGFVFTNVPELNIVGGGLTYGKIKASLGKIQKEAPVYLDPNYALAKSSILTPALNIDRIAVSASNLKPEQLNFIELGAELRLLNDKLSFELTYFRNKTSDAYMPSFVDFNMATLVNGGSITNKGIEASLEANILSQGEFNWRLTTNFSRYSSMVTKLPEGVQRIPLAGFREASSSLIEGEPYGALYGTRYLRNENGDLVIGADGFPLVDAEMGVIGNPNPDWTMGVLNTFDYKGISLGFLLDLRYGGDVWNGTANTLNYFGTSALTGSQRTIRGYVFDGVDENGNPNTLAVDFAPVHDLQANRWVRYGRAGVAEDAIEDASWIRLRELSLSYRFGQQLFSRLGLKSMAVTLYANNLFLITRYSGVDPESNLTGNSNGRGLDYFNIPNTKTYGLSLKLGL